MINSLKLTIEETIDGTHEQRALMTFWKNEKDDVMMASSANSFAPGGPPPLDNDENALTEFRFSVHPSKESKDGINVIKRTALYANKKPKLEERLMTKAIKQKDGFQSIFFRIAPLQQTFKSDIDNRPDQVICVGRHDPQFSTVMYQVLVGSADVRFSVAKTWDLCVSQFVMNDYRFVVIYNFWAVPSSHYGLMLENRSFKENVMGPEPVFGFGVSPKDSVTLYREYRRLAAGQYADGHKKMGQAGPADARWIYDLPSFTARPLSDRGPARKSTRKFFQNLR